MEFDINKVFTTLDAEQVKVGSVGYFANTYSALKQQVQKDTGPKKLTYVFSQDYEGRFQEAHTYAFNLFYLVEEPRDISSIKFDKSKVMTPVTAGDAEIGSKGYFADDLHRIEMLVTRGSTDIRTLSRILDTSSNCRFADHNDNSYILFYPIEED